MALGITLARGQWEIRRSAITSLAQGQFQKGDLVGLDHARLASLMTSSNFTSVFGVAVADSQNSLPTGFCLIAIPRPGCTAMVDLLTTGGGEAASGLSFGQSGSIVSAAGRTSTFSLLAASQASQWVQIVGVASSTDSRIEVAFIQKSAVVYSVSSVTFGA